MPKFNGHTNTRHVTRIVGDILTSAQVSDLKGRDDPNLLRIVPRMNHALGFVPWPALNVGMFCLVADLMRQGYKAPLAAQIGVRIMDAHLSAPDVDQWAVIVTENGNVSTLDFKTVDLSTGFISGSRLAFALVVDVRLYAERVNRALSAVHAGSEEARADA